MRYEDLPFQEKVRNWLISTFGDKIAEDKIERCDRFMEESLELVQSLNISKERILALVDYVYNRPIGNPNQELGGVMVTLAALCYPHGLDMMWNGERELERNWENQDKIRQKQATKPIGSALPQ